MPVLAILIILLAIYALTLPNADRGLRFLFEPEWSVLTEPTVYIAALGQAFFSIGLGMAIFITFGSYIPASFSLYSSAAITAFGVSLLRLSQVLLSSRPYFPLALTQRLARSSPLSRCRRYFSKCRADTSSAPYLSYCFPQPQLRR